MARIECRIEVQAAVNAVYAQLIRFSDYPRFLEGVLEVKPLDANHLAWRSSTDGVVHEWESELIDQVPGRRIAWHNLTDHKNDGYVELQPLDADHTRIVLSMEIDAPADVQSAEAYLAQMRQQSEGNLQRLKELIESAEDSDSTWRTIPPHTGAADSELRSP